MRADVRAGGGRRSRVIKTDENNIYQGGEGVESKVLGYIVNYMGLRDFPGCFVSWKIQERLVNLSISDLCTG